MPTWLLNLNMGKNVGLHGFKMSLMERNGFKSKSSKLETKLKTHDLSMPEKISTESLSTRGL